MPQLREHGLYVEGHCVSHGWFVFEHAWVEMDGKIVEPTLLKDATGNNLAYFAGPCFTLAQVLEECRAKRASRRTVAQLPLVRKWGRGGMDHPLFQQSYLSAWSFAHPPVADALADVLPDARSVGVELPSH
jgi:hypothetical protein